MICGALQSGHVRGIQGKRRRGDEQQQHLRGKELENGGPGEALLVKKQDSSQEGAPHLLNQTR